MALNTWDVAISKLPGASFLQTTLWSGIKQDIGWQPLFLFWDETKKVVVWDGLSDLPDRIIAAALVLKRSITIKGYQTRYNILYVPRGPLLDWSNSELRGKVLNDLYLTAREEDSIFIKIDAEVVLQRGETVQTLISSSEGREVQADLSSLGWLFSGNQIQFRNTVLIDLLPDEDTILKGMKQKTRYNIRLASRKGVTIRSGTTDDYDTLYTMYATTSIRDHFVVRPKNYYHNLWTIFNQAGLGEFLIAEVNKTPVAALFLIHYASKAWYFNGMSSDLYREFMPNYLLQWEAIRLAKSYGCQGYDLWGAPEHFDESDPLWGVYRFKEGFGGELVNTLGAWDRPLRPQIYAFYINTLPQLLGLFRKKRIQSTKSDLQP